VIVVDASALVAIADLEDDSRRYLEAIERATAASISAINAVEAGIVLISRRRIRDIEEFDRWLSDLRIQVDTARTSHAAALAAYLRFGRGYHPARLNLADCFAYALAKSLDAPLLYKGDDFRQTDVTPAIQPT
jgi:ribonuclease VapC